MGRVCRFNDKALSILEKQAAPPAVCQYVERHVYPLALSAGFLEPFGHTGRAAACSLSKQNALFNTHPDDVGRVRAAVRRFAVQGGSCEGIFRAKRHMGRDRIAISFTASGSACVPIRVCCL